MPILDTQYGDHGDPGGWQLGSLSDDRTSTSSGPSPVGTSLYYLVIEGHVTEAGRFDAGRYSVTMECESVP